MDNYICERALKMAILHRKSSLSYQTLKGAQTGDLFMSLIHSCRLNGSTPSTITGQPKPNRRQAASSFPSLRANRSTLITREGRSRSGFPSRPSLVLSPICRNLAIEAESG
jgi:hypothetical protein